MQLTANLKKKTEKEILAFYRRSRRKKSFKNFTEASPKMHITLSSISFRDLYVNHEHIYVLPGDLYFLFVHQLWNIYPAFRDVKMLSNACSRIFEKQYKSSKGRDSTHQILTSS